MFLLRHGQSAFNLHFTRTRRDPGIVDPALTPEGIRQARAAGQALAPAGITRVITSPYTRTLQTAAEVTKSLAARIDIDPLVRERFAFTCDIGTPRAALAKDWPAHDFTAMDEVWWPSSFEPERDVILRAGQFRQAMATHSQSPQTLLVSHWGFLLALTGRSLDNGAWIEWDPAEAAPLEILWQ